MKTLSVQVTQEDIDQGIQGSYFECPVALAINRVARGDYIWVDALNLTKTYYAIVIADHNEITKNFIGRFDYSAISIQPFVAVWEIPEKYQKLFYFHNRHED